MPVPQGRQCATPLSCRCTSILLWQSRLGAGAEAGIWPQQLDARYGFDVQSDVAR
jgi:hypothetical protein